MKPYPAVKTWLRQRSATEKAAPIVDADLAKAIADTEGIASVKGKVSASEEEEGDPAPSKKVATKKVAASASGKKPAAGEKKDDDEEEESSMGQVFKRVMGQKADDDEEEEGGEEEEGEKDDVEVEVNKKFAPIDENTSGNLGKKIGEFSKQNKSIRKELIETTKKAKALEAENAVLKQRPEKALKVEETDEFKALQKELDEQRALVDQVALERSPTFRKQFDEKILSMAKKTKPLILSVKDDEKRKKLVNGLDVLLKIDPGEEGDERFYAGVSELFEELELPTFTATKLSGMLDNIRELGNEKHLKLNDWQKTKGDITKMDLEGRQAQVRQVKTLFSTVRAQYEAQAQARLNAYRERNDIFQYDDRYKAEFEAVMPSLEKAAETGVIDETLIKYIHNGMEAPIISFQLQLAAKQLVAQAKELANLKKKYGVTDEQKPKPGAPHKEKKEDEVTDEEIEQGGLVSTFRKLHRQ